MSAGTGALPDRPNIRSGREDPYRLGHRRHGHGHSATGHGEGGPASRYVIVAYGFWIFLLSDIIMFSAFFAAYAVLSGETAGGPGGAELFDVPRVMLQTALLLTSSVTCGIGSLAAQRRNLPGVQLWLMLTGLFGAAFLALEVQEFAEMIAEGAGPGRSAFLSAFFALVGCHGIHVTLGLLWLGTMMAQLMVKGFRPDILRRLHCFNLFWHALDIIWIAIFTLVYLLGAGP
ncbi:cytochrome o ubiquinol oxidase subunit 3 [Pseudoxanthobacter soli DSM 19599]|uniref:Cytochrome bo(3) ubiquinol oxidase subunit 3 n=1 Tax=Pseudoxanthobacter soli DSM 19599 TaxID=1123029 RepID=A0A1M7ZNF4_9HYPH|nr:cytochrome o ubiquinol oxidase subunit III [Pseudoxanthobacter soli]SHO66423.1 cytochrome o ubiquinol oxidase subunit 3 [Pseudoxanthobacter soli DSM 19599]